MNDTEKAALRDLVGRLAHALRSRTAEGSRFPSDLNPHLLDEPARVLLESYRKLVAEAEEIPPRMTQTGSTYLALENQALRDYFVSMRKLLLRTADALEGQCLSIEEKKLISELRKAAEP